MHNGRIAETVQRKVAGSRKALVSRSWAGGPRVFEKCRSGRFAGWVIADHMRADLVVDALKAAERTRGSLAGAVMHTDHGAQYCSRAFADACRRAGVRHSMGAIGSSADNALAEPFNATCKREILQGSQAWNDEREARLDLFRWLHRYNTVRRHSPLGHRSPIAYEQGLRTTSTTLAEAA
ncbi:transposase [Streptomyces sp. NBC_01462]|uniref:transposase n=1 Tax=Streptomyces sp. NBC_01462 TaxID=2903876 RepID=UPI003FCE1714